MTVGDDATVQKAKTDSSSNGSEVEKQTRWSRAWTMLSSLPTGLRRRWRSRRRLADVPLGVATAFWLSVFLIAASGVVYLLGRPWRTDWRLIVGELNWDKQLLYAGGVVTLSGAVVALVVNYRKQKDAETGRFSAAFAEATRQLGDASPAVRIAGVYALAAIADSYRDRRQQCIDVLCGYIRLPYDPDAGAGHVTEKSVETIEETDTKTVIKHAYRADDREVRLTIIRTIRDHLRADAAVSWQGCDFDFTGATFDGGDFSAALFSGGEVNFRRAVFSGGTVDFGGAVFSGAMVNFRRAVFSDGTVDFGAVFSGGRLDLSRAEVSGGTVDFVGAVFARGSEVDLSKAAFLEGKVDFDEAKFSGGRVSFDEAKFSGGHVSFDEATFSGGHVSFDEATFYSGRANFLAALFYGGKVSFIRAVFRGAQVSFERGFFLRARVSFDLAEFDLGRIYFTRAKFSGAHISFDEVMFSKARVSFDQATFSGGQVYLIGSMFSGGQLSFARAKVSGGEVKISSAIYEDFSSELIFDQAAFSTGHVRLEVPRTTPTPEGTVTFREAVWGGATVEVNGQVVHSAEEAERALASP